MQQYSKAAGRPGFSRHVRLPWRGKTCTISNITRLQGCSGCPRCLPIARPHVQGSSRSIQRTSATAAGQPDSTNNKAGAGAGTGTAAVLSSGIAVGLKQPAATDPETVASADSPLEVVQAGSSNVSQAIKTTAQCLLQVLAAMVQSAALVDEGKVNHQFRQYNARGWDIVLRLPLPVLAKSTRCTPVIKLRVTSSPVRGNCYWYLLVYATVCAANLPDMQPTASVCSAICPKSALRLTSWGHTLNRTVCDPRF